MLRLQRTISAVGHVRSRVTGSWPARGAVAGLLWLGAIMVALWGCSPERDYEVLSFFFDGVPVPGAATEPSDEEIAATQPGGAQAPTSQPVEYVYHGPYQRRQCFGCHNQSTGKMEITATEASELCKNCHSAYYRRPAGSWVHGPVAANLCRYCHEPHKSEYAGLLRLPQPQLCFECHNQPQVRAAPYHAAIGEKPCSTCHDPHLAGNHLLLVDSHSYQNRRLQMLDNPAHSKWDDQTCSKCHQAEHSNQLVADVNHVCLSCHTKIQHPDTGGPVHKAVLDGKCTSCHTPHKSPLPHLLIPKAEQVCYQCHKPQEIAQPSHPRVVRANCLLCHNGHVGAQPHLLRADIPIPRPRDGTPPAPAPTTTSAPAGTAPTNMAPLDTAPMDTAPAAPTPELDAAPTRPDPSPAPAPAGGGA